MVLIALLKSINVSSFNAVIQAPQSIGLKRDLAHKACADSKGCCMTAVYSFCSGMHMSLYMSFTAKISKHLHFGMRPNPINELEIFPFGGKVLVMDGSTLVPPGQPGVKQKFLTHLSLRNTVVQPEARASLHAIVDDSSESLRELVLVSSRSCIHIWEGLLSRATSLQSLTLGGKLHFLQVISKSGQGRASELLHSVRS